MTRRWFALLIGFVLGTTLVTSVWGQEATQRKSLADRMAALRRGWSPEDPEPKAAPQQSAPPAANRSVTGSLLPSWLGGREEDPAAQSKSQSSQAHARRALREGSQPSRNAQAPGTKASPRTAARPRPNSPQSAAANSNRSSLPGLGGSPLPLGSFAPQKSGSTTQSNKSQDVISDYPVVRGDSPGAATRPATNAGSAQRSKAGTTTKNAARPSPVRNSPARRTVPHLSAEEMRRELSGSFSESANSSPTARTAQTDEKATSRNTTLPPATNEPPKLSEDRSSVNMPLTLPTFSEPINQKNSDTAGATTRENIQPITQPVVSAPSQGASEAFGDGPSLKSSFSTGGFTRSPQLNSAPVGSRAVRGKEAFGEALQVANGGDPTILVSNQTPVITTEIRGPKQILVGREAVYRVRLQNEGTSGAEGIVASVRIPAWAQVIDTVATQGSVQPSQNAATPAQVEWHLPNLEPRAIETLDIRLIPRESRPLELGISWTLAPVGSRAIVEVQEAKLNVDVAGPTEVLFDKPQVFRLTLSNPGTGTAENVKLELVPPGSGRESATTHTIGELLPGDSKTVEIELTAREAGKLMVQAIASAEGGLSSEISKEIFCRKPELELDWRGPATKYAGTTATYFIRVRNPGTAPAEDITVKVKLPEGAEFISGSEGQTFSAQGREVAWQLGTLAPGDDSYMELKCVVKAAGMNQLQVTATNAAGNLSDSATAETNVIALADLKLEVSDPSGPIAVGSPATYEIRVQNRGSSTAKNVNIVALFSDGIEPDQAEGAMFTVTDGRVTFRTIEDLPAGREIALRIRAHAVQPGTHVFRAEVHCADAEIKLAAEETTRFYADDVMPESEQPQQQAAGDRYDAVR